MYKDFLARCVSICGNELPSLTTDQQVSVLHWLAVSADRQLFLVGLDADQEEDGTETYQRFALVVMDESIVGEVGEQLWEAWKANLPPVVGWLRCRYYPDGNVTIRSRSPYPGEVSAHPTRVVDHPWYGVVATWDWNVRDVRIYVDPLRAGPQILPTLRREAAALDKAAAAEAARAAEIEAREALARREAEHDRYRAWRDGERHRPGYEW